MLTIGSLFSGIGGLELGLEWAGLGPVRWQVEQDKFRRDVLGYHWPDAAHFEDVCTVGAADLERVELICGGFPCQDNSSAGARAGLAGDRSGLWRQFARVIGELSPRWVVVENVAGGVNWIDDVVHDLGELGYASLPVPLAGADVGAPHLRPRVFIVGRHANAQGEPVGPVDAEMARVPGASAIVSPWALFPSVRVAYGVSSRMAAFGDAVIPKCAEVIGWVVREMMEGQP